MVKVMKRTWFFVVGLLVVLVGLIAWRLQPETSANIPVVTSSPTPTAKPTTTEVTLQGKVICLPHKNTNGSQTLECAFGLQDGQGNNYALQDTDPEYRNLAQATNGRTVTVVGTLVTGDSSQYNIVGTIAVKSLNLTSAVKLNTIYIKPVDWPPQLRTVNQPYVCTVAGKETDRAGKTEKRTINGKEYCVTRVTEGAAGSIYAQYAYATRQGGQTLIATFSLKAVQCGNYPEPQRTACETERASFSPDLLVDKILRP